MKPPKDILIELGAEASPVLDDEVMAHIDYDGTVYITTLNIYTPKGKLRLKGVLRVPLSRLEWEPCAKNTEADSDE